MFNHHECDSVSRSTSYTKKALSVVSCRRQVERLRSCTISRSNQNHPQEKREPIVDEIRDGNDQRYKEDIIDSKSVAERSIDIISMRRSKSRTRLVESVGENSSPEVVRSYEDNGRVRLVDDDSVCCNEETISHNKGTSRHIKTIAARSIEIILARRLYSTNCGRASVHDNSIDVHPSTDVPDNSTDVPYRDYEDNTRDFRASSGEEVVSNIGGEDRTKLTKLVSRGIEFTLARKTRSRTRIRKHKTEDRVTKECLSQNNVKVREINNELPEKSSSENNVTGATNEAKGCTTASICSRDTRDVRGSSIGQSASGGADNKLNNITSRGAQFILARKSRSRTRIREPEEEKPVTKECSSQNDVEVREIDRELMKKPSSENNVTSVTSKTKCCTTASILSRGISRRSSLRQLSTRKEEQPTCKTQLDLVQRSSVTCKLSSNNSLSGVCGEGTNDDKEGEIHRSSLKCEKRVMPITEEIDQKMSKTTLQDAEDLFDIRLEAPLQPDIPSLSSVPSTTEQGKLEHAADDLDQQQSRSGSTEQYSFENNATALTNKVKICTSRSIFSRGISRRSLSRSSLSHAEETREIEQPTCKTHSDLEQNNTKIAKSP